MNSVAKYCLSTLCATAVIAVPLVFAAKPPPPPTRINVTSLVYDQDSSANQYLFRSDLYGGVNQTTYTTTGGVTTGVGLISPYGWGLDLFSQTFRKVWITLNPVNSSTPPAPSNYYSEKVEIYSWCYDSSNNYVAYLSIPAGTSNNRCIFSFDFEYGRTTYKLAMGQFSPPASGWATVTCHASSSPSGTPCTSWTIAPNMIDGNATIANLYIIGSRNGPQFVGQYYNTFRIDVTNP
jgi:hypothetical protein